MHVYIDYQIFLRQKYGGISRYFYEIIVRSRQNKDILISVDPKWAKNYYLSKYLGYTPLKYSSSFVNYGARLINKIFLGVKILKNNIYREKKIDIIVPTYFSNSYLYKINKRAKLIIIVYDMIHENYFTENESMGRRRIRKGKERLLHQADGIIAISNNTKKELLQRYPELENVPIEIIYPGYSFRESTMTSQEVRDKLGVQDYILYVGGRDKYKNFGVFVEAMGDICLRYTNIKVICVGGDAFNKEEKQTIGQAGIENKIFQVSLDDDILTGVYRSARAFIFPSLYEGFGMPILEAFVNECPVILADQPCFREVAGDAALFFDPYSKNSLADAVAKVIEVPGVATNLTHLGKMQLEKYSWDNSAVAFQKFMQTVYNSRDKK